MPSHRSSSSFCIAVAGALLVACSATSTLPPFDGALALGTWGGDSAGMIVGDTAMHLHVGCTYGDVSGRIQVVAGQFDVSGSYMLRAYPIAIGPSVPARFTGRIDGTTAIVTVTVNDTVQHKTVVLGPATVILGRDPKLMPCPICRRPILTRSPASVAHFIGVRTWRSTAAVSTWLREYGTAK